MEGAQGPKFSGGRCAFSRLKGGAVRAPHHTSLSPEGRGRHCQFMSAAGNQQEIALKCWPAASLTHPSPPLQAEGLSRRVYPFIGLAIVGLVSFHGFAAVTNSL